MKTDNISINQSEFTEIDSASIEPKKISRSRSVEKKKSSTEIFQELLQCLRPILDKRFLVYADDQGRTTILEKVSKFLVQAVVLDSVISYATKELDKFDITIPRKSVLSLIEGWIDRCPRVSKLPPAFSLNKSEYAFAHLVHDIKDIPTPLFDDLVNRCGPNGTAFKAFIWASINSEIKLQQYLWLYGKGKDGKGSITRLISKIVGKKSTVGLSAKDNYWVAQCVGKRIGFFNDLNNTTIQLSSEFKQITGGDATTVTNKFEKAYSTTLDTVFIFSTNEQITIFNNRADKRRCIYIELTAPATLEKNYEDRLEAEISGILYKSKLAFEYAWNSIEQEIENDQSSLEKKIDENEIEFESAFENNFEYSEGETLTRAEVYQQVKKLFPFTQQYNKFKDYLKTKHDIFETTTRIESKKKNVFMNIKKLDYLK